MDILRTMMSIHRFLDYIVYNGDRCKELYVSYVYDKWMIRLERFYFKFKFNDKPLILKNDSEPKYSQLVIIYFSIK